MGHAAKLLGVVRIFRWVGWLGLTLSTAAALALIYVSIADNRLDWLWSVAFCAAAGWIAVKFINVAKQLATDSPDARKRARALCLLLLPGIPIFTIAGIWCLLVLDSN